MSETAAQREADGAVIGGLCFTAFLLLLVYLAEWATRNAWGWLRVVAICVSALPAAACFLGTVIVFIESHSAERRRAPRSRSS